MLAGSAMLLASASAAAADPNVQPPAFEITPFIGYRVGGSFTEVDTQHNTQQSVSLNDHGSFALALDARADYGSQYELFYSRQSTAMQGFGFAPVSLTVEYLHLGGTLLLDEQPRLQTYLAGGLGLTRLAPDSLPGQEDTRFSMSLALGLRVPLSRNFQLRFEGRGYVTFMASDAAIFCRSDQSGGICQITAKGSTFFQFDLLAGVAFLF
jgi:opacity protein-like surface antigen